MHAKSLFEFGYNVWAYDISKRMLDVASRLGVRVVENIKEDHYDVVYCLNCSFDYSFDELGKTLSPIKKITRELFILNVDVPSTKIKHKVIESDKFFTRISVYPKGLYRNFIYEIYDKKTGDKYVGLVRRLNLDKESWIKILGKYFEVLECVEMKGEYWFVLK